MACFSKSGMCQGPHRPLVHGKRDRTGMVEIMALFASSSVKEKPFL